jgi:hypothetical protein
LHEELLLVGSHILPLDFSAQNKWSAHILDKKHINDMVYHENLHILENRFYHREPPGPEFNNISPRQNCFCGK